MAACVRCLRKARPIFKQHILALYPSPPDALTIQSQNPATTNPSSPDYSLFHDPLAQPRNLSDLTFYAQMFPNKLTRIGRYMVKKMRQYIREQNPRSVHLSMLAMIGLVDACHSDDLLVLYDESVCEELRLLLVHPLPEHRILAAQGLCKLMNYVDEAADFRKYEQFFQPLLDMCTDTDAVSRTATASVQGAVQQPAGKPQDEVASRVRLSGLQGLSAMVLHFYSQRLVNHYQDIVPAVLVNVSSDDVQPAVVNEADSTVTAATISACAHETLSLLAAKVSIPDLDSALTPLFAGLDSWGWLPATRCASVLAVLANGVQSDSDLVLFEVLKHALVFEQKVQLRGDAVDFKCRILRVAALLIAAMRINVLHWQGICDLILHHAVAASRSASPAAPAYAAAVHGCFSAYAIRLPTPQDLISLLFHLTQFASTSTPVLKVSLLSCANSIVVQAPDLSTGVDSVFNTMATIDSLVRSLLTCAVLTQEVTVRERAYQVLLNLLLPPLETDEEGGAVAEADEGRAKAHRLLAAVTEGKSLDDGEKSARLNEKEQRWILTVLYYELSCSIAPTPGAMQPVSMTVVDTSSSSSSPPPVTVDSVMVVLEDERSLTSNIKAPGRGADVSAGVRAGVSAAAGHAVPVAGVVARAAVATRLRAVPAGQRAADHHTHQRHALLGAGGGLAVRGRPRVRAQPVERSARDSRRAPPPHRSARSPGGRRQRAGVGGCGIRPPTAIARSHGGTRSHCQPTSPARAGRVTRLPAVVAAARRGQRLAGWGRRRRPLTPSALPLCGQGAAGDVRAAGREVPTAV